MGKKKSSNKAAARKRFPVGELSRKRQELKKLFLAKNASLQVAKKDIDNVSKRIKRHKEKIVLLSVEEQSLQAKKRKLEDKKTNKLRASLKRNLTIRRKAPSKLDPHNSEKLQCSLSVRSNRRRRKETLDVCQSIHGDAEGETSAALDGMWATMVNESTSGRLETYLDKSRKIRSKVIPSLMSKQVKEYQDSNDNMCRSLKILYEDGLLAKKKYKSICRNVKATVGQSITNPKLVYYDKLIAFIKSVDVQNVHDFASEFNKDTSKFEEPINGSYRDFCSYIKVLAELYIQVDQALGSESFFQHFGALPYHFRIAIGADGAPFGKDDEATASSSYVGKHIQSERDNFLLCGANCSEDHPSMKQYAKKLMQDIAHIETQSYIISGFNCKSTVELVPSDMKWLSTMSGELNNAAYYFSPFGNVNDDNKR
ncbi:Hypothetical predicted protein, partial [Paramuricea clavata]